MLSLILPKPMVFISYAHRDAANLATRLHQDLTAGATWTIEIERAIDTADTILAILTPGSFDSAICRAEQLRALRKGKPVIPLRAQHDAVIPLHLEPGNYRDFTSPAAYNAAFAQFLEDTPALPERFCRTLVTAPPLPRKYLEIPEALAALRDAVRHAFPGGIVWTTVGREPAHPSAAPGRSRQDPR